MPLVRSRSETVLDLGGARWMLSWRLRRLLEGKVIGIDLTDEMVKMARKGGGERVHKCGVQAQ